MQTSVFLAINDSTITIPYPGTDREDHPHAGFIPLKGRPGEVDGLPEVQDSNALKHAVTKINDTSTPFFTVACRKAFNSEEGNFWARGYIEFSFNYIEVAKDSPNYFLLFEQFNRYVLESKFDLPVEFKFELQKADLAEIKAAGYTACVWITTTEFPTTEAAQMTWNQGVGFLAEFLCNFTSPPSLKAIYEG